MDFSTLSPKMLDKTLRLTGDPEIVKMCNQQNIVLPCMKFLHTDNVKRFVVKDYFSG